jgi:hypothetical protein
MRLWLAIFVVAAQSSLRVERERVLHYDMETRAVGPFVSEHETGASGLLWSRVVIHETAVSGVRIHVEVVSAPANVAWRVEVRDLAGTLVESMAGDAFPLANGEFWTTEIPGRGGEIRLVSDAPADDLQIQIARYAYRVARAIPQAITGGHNGMVALRDAPPLVRGWAGPIARLRIMMEEGQGNCTGFLVSRELLLTNHHCFAASAELPSTLVEFGFDTYGATVERARGIALEAEDAALDYAVVRLRPVPAPRWGRIVLQPPPAPLEDQALVVIQHPGGEPKRVSLLDCTVDGTTRAGVGGGPTDFGHQCDTEGGSSGSPVLDAHTGELVGLHHWGFTEADALPVNQAVHIALILEDLRTKHPALLQEIAANP